ncbi:unnamed protein product [Victoria cruziana]
MYPTRLRSETLLLKSTASPVAVTSLMERKMSRSTVDLGNGSEVVYFPKFLPPHQSWDWLKYLDEEIPWIRPTIRVYGRCITQRNVKGVESKTQLKFRRLCHFFCLSFAMPRDSCYVASEGLPELKYSGYQPVVHHWDEFPPLKDILKAVHEALPGSRFNSLLLNRYKDGSDYVAWHADDEKLYGPTPEIASVTFGREREFLLKRRPTRSTKVESSKGGSKDKHSFMLKHGSLLVMKGYTQRDWLHSVPKRASALGVRINLTFRHVQSPMPSSTIHSA